MGSSVTTQCFVGAIQHVLVFFL